jgi:hypothetical protein
VLGRWNEVTPRRTALRGLAAAAIFTVIPLVAGLLPASEAATHTSAAEHLQVAPVAGSAHYLAYVTGTSGHKSFVPGDATSGTLHVLTQSGNRMNLGAIARDPGFSLVASTLIETSFAGTTENVRWWDLADATHGSASVAAPKRVVGAAPDGWLTTTQIAAGRILYQHFYGRTTNLGDPLPAHVGLSVVTGPSGFVAQSEGNEDGNGEIVYLPWSHPHTHRVLQKPKGQENACSAVDAHWAACSLASLPHSPLALIRVTDGKQVRTTNRCRFDIPAVFTGHAAWVEPGSQGCTRGRLEMLNRHGQITASTRHDYNSYFRVGALDQFVTTNKPQTKLLGLRAANGNPKVLASA